MKVKPKYNSKTIGRYKPDKSMVKLVHPPTPPQTDLAFIYNNNIYVYTWTIVSMN
jgi:hypothetical protein